MLLVDMRETMARHGERGPTIHAHVRAPSIAVFNAMSLLARPADILRYGAGTKSTGWQLGRFRSARELLPPSSRACLLRLGSPG